MKRACSILIAALACVPMARAQSEPKPAQPASAPAKPQPHEPTLDELLGLPKVNPAPSKPEEIVGPLPQDTGDAPDRTKAELERQLSPAEVTEAFEQAVQLMGQTAERLDKS